MTRLHRDVRHQTSEGGQAIVGHRAKHQSDPARRFAWLQIVVVGPAYFVLAAIFPKPGEANSWLRGGVVGAILSCLGVLLLYRLRTDADSSSGRRSIRREMPGPE